MDYIFCKYQYLVFALNTFEDESFIQMFIQEYLFDNLLIQWSWLFVRQEAILQKIMLTPALLGSDLNYYSKKYISQTATKPKKKKIPAISLSHSKSRKPAQAPTSTNKQKKEKQIEVSYLIEIQEKGQDSKKQYEENESMVGFFFDQSKPSVIDCCKSFKFNENPIGDITQTTPIKHILQGKLNQDSEESKGEEEAQPPLQLENNPETLSSEMKKVLSEPDIACPMSPSLTALPRRKTECITKSKQFNQKPDSKSKKIVNRFLKRFVKFQDKEDGKSKNIPQQLGKIAEKVEEDDLN